MAAACAARATGHGTFRFTGGAGGLACSRTSIMFRTSAPSSERQDLRAVQEQGQTLTLASPVMLRTKSLSCRVLPGVVIIFRSTRKSRADYLPTTSVVVVSIRGIRRGAQRVRRVVDLGRQAATKPSRQRTIAQLKASKCSASLH